MTNILSWTVFIPTIGAALCLFVPRRAVRWVAVLSTLAAFVLSLLLFGTFFGAWDDPSAVFGTRYGTLHHVDRADWITIPGKLNIEYFMGIDGLSFPLFILTTLISLLACLASWNFEEWHINKGLRAYFILFLLLETGMLGVFVAMDFFLFYIFWEVMLLPMYFLIGVWGGPRKEYAAIKFFLFTLGGSVLMLVALVAMYFYSGKAIANLGGSVASAYQQGVQVTHGTFDLIEMAINPQIQAYFAAQTTTFLDLRFAPVMFMFLFIGFAIKLPSVPVHTWLPDAHVEAPTPISMILAGVLLKMGGYGFLRICYPIFPTGGEYWAFTLAVIGVVSILYGALCAMAQTDFKKLVAYSSVSHMGYVLLGIAVMTQAGFQGAMFQMIAHGISSPMCFFLVGVIYERAHHREINRFGGLWLTMPKYGTLATIGFFASLGLPGLCGFIGEVWVLIGTFNAGAKYSWAYPMAILAAAGVILTAGYILWLIRRVYLGKERHEYHEYPDANPRETAILVPFAVLCIALGIFPMQTVFAYTNGTLDLVLDIVRGAVAVVP
jgi:NADH-quinone oxidoreductase subunit M